MIIQNLKKCLIKIILFLLVVLNAMKKHFKNYSKFVEKYLNSNSKIIEIGSNDGTFLKNFLKTNNQIIGFEPSKSVANVAMKKYFQH